MKIAEVLFARGVSAFFFDDQRAIKQGAAHDGFVYTGAPVTPGFTQIRQAGESVSILLLLDDGQIACGDCAAVQYSGAGGRDPLFLAEAYLPLLEKHLRPQWRGVELGSFRDMSAALDAMRIDGRPLHSAVRYGASMALLDAVARATRRMPCEVVCAEYGLPVIAERVPIFGQSGDNRYEHVDKMVLKGVDVLPHGLINNIDEKLGRQGEKLRDYIRWLVGRIRRLRRDEAYCPALHIDVYGNIGPIFDHDTDRIAGYLASLEPDAGGLPLFIEGPVDMEAREPQIEALQRITRRLEQLGSRVGIVADEWCNTYEDVRAFTDARACPMVQIKTPDLGGVQHIVESVIYCREHGMMAYQGGTCNETDLTARLCVHLAMAARAERLLAKPGMGFDEGYSIVNNEMERILAVLRARKEPAR